MWVNIIHWPHWSHEVRKKKENRQISSVLELIYSFSPYVENKLLVWTLVRLLDSDQIPINTVENLLKVWRFPSLQAEGLMFRFNLPLVFLVLLLLNMIFPISIIMWVNHVFKPLFVATYILSMNTVCFYIHMVHRSISIPPKSL